MARRHCFVPHLCSLLRSTRFRQCEGSGAFLAVCFSEVSRLHAGYVREVSLGLQGVASDCYGFNCMRGAVVVSCFLCLLCMMQALR